MFEVTADGFTAPTVEEIQAELNEQLLTNVDPALVLSADQPLAQITGIMAEKFAELGELSQVAYNAFNRHAAEGFALDNIGDLNGTGRNPATKSFVTAQVTLGASFSQPAGVLIANVVGQPTIRFTNKNTVTSTTAGDYSAIFEALDYGPTVANAGTLTVITAPVSGWNAVSNLVDATVGALEETDTPYRQRQETELSASGSSTVDGIRADILRVPGVQECFVFENTTNVTSPDGLPPHSIEVVIFDGTTPTAVDAQVLLAVWKNKPGGTETYGNVSGLVTGSDGVARMVSFSRALVKTLYLTYELLVVDPAFFPVDGITKVKEAARQRGVDILKLGVDVISLQFKGAALSVPGVVDVPTLRMGFAPSPSGTANLTVGSREIAKLDTANISVTIA